MKCSTFSGRFQLGLILLLLTLYTPSEGHAGPVDEIRVGVLYHDLGLWGGSGNEGGFDFNGELIFSPSLELLSGILRPNLGFSLNSEGNTSMIYGGALWEYRWPRGYFFDLGFGLAAHNGETDEGNVDTMNQLGSTVLFRTVIEAGFTIADRHVISLMFDHISNAYLADPNEGLDTLGLRYGFRF
jgi:hypothetical protein